MDRYSIDMWGKMPEDEKPEDLVNRVHEKTREREVHFFNHAIKGDLQEVGGPPRYNDQSENIPQSQKYKKKKRVEDKVMYVLMDMAQEAFDRMMEYFDGQLDHLRNMIQKLEKKMEENRRVWEANAHFLNDIDDVMAGFGDGGTLDHDKVAMLLPATDVHGLDDAQLITLVQQKRNSVLEENCNLDNGYILLEQDHTRFRVREEKVLAAKQRLEEIHVDPLLDAEEKARAIEKLGQEIGTKALHATATQTNDQDANGMADDIVDSKIRTDLGSGINLSVPGIN